MMRIFILVSVVFSLCVSGLQARQFDQSVDDLFSKEPEFLPVDEAFVFDFAQQGSTLVLRFDIADGYYLYKKQFKTVVKDAQLSEPSFPPSVEIEDEFFGVSEVFYQQVSLTYDIKSAAQDAVVKIRYQGCADAGLCYPPTTKVIYLQAFSGDDVAAGNVAMAPTQSQQFELQALLAGDDSLLWSLLLFLLLGVGLAFTPCVFPMYPIISSIVVGQGTKPSSSRILSLSIVYVQGMAITYSLLGLLVASAGVQFQAALQHPLILSVFIVLFVALAIAMFGAYELQLPASWQNKLNSISQQQKGGAFGGVFMMGAISGLIASPCTTAPLTGILLYIAQSGDLVLGFTALYALSLGMGIPLIAFAVTGGKLLPKAGNWMNVVKVVFGFMMLSVALLFVERLMENIWTNLAWSLLGLSLFSYLQVVNQETTATFGKGVRNLVIFVGLLISGLYGYQQLALENENNSAALLVSKAHPEFQRVKDLADFDKKLAAANAQGKSVMIDLYADWCVACKEFEKYTFTDPNVQNALSNTVWMQIDLTDNTPTNLDFQKHFSILGLPTILFFDEQGSELSKARVTGFMNAETFARHVEKALAK